MKLTASSEVLQEGFVLNATRKNHTFSFLVSADSVVPLKAAWREMKERGERENRREEETEESERQREVLQHNCTLCEIMINL
jgi:hypothetical protein